MSITIGKRAPDLSAPAYLRDASAPVTVHLTGRPGRWLVLAFYPADFTFVCPTELRDFAEFSEDFAAIDADLVAVSTDGYYTHLAWFESEPLLESVDFPIVADTSHEVSAAYGVLAADGTARRATFVIDGDGIVRHMAVNDGSVGRSAEELLRTVCALQTGELCPANWRPGHATLGVAA